MTPKQIERLRDFIYWTIYNKLITIKLHNHRYATKEMIEQLSKELCDAIIAKITTDKVPI